MTTVEPTSPVRVSGRLDERPSRWLWLLKWLMLLPHVVILVVLWFVVFLLTVIAFFAILFTARYPRPVFYLTLGVMRWTWRVCFYGYNALGTDRYPPFTLDEEPDYPATLDIDYPQRLSRGLVLVKWWLLAIPHYVILAFFVGGWGRGWDAGRDQHREGSGDWGDGGLIAVITLFVALALLFVGRYPTGLFNLLMGMNRWVWRVAAYALLMTDAYPPFRLDQGGAEPTAPARASATPEPPAPDVPGPGPASP